MAYSWLEIIILVRGWLLIVARNWCTKSGCIPSGIICIYTLASLSWMSRL